MAFTVGQNDSVIYDAQRVQLAYDRINATKRPSLFPRVENWRQKFERRALLIQENIRNPDTVVPDIHTTFGRSLATKHVLTTTFGTALSRARNGPSQYDIKNNPGIALQLLPEPKVVGGRISMHRPPNEDERRIIRSSSMPGPNAYDYISKTWSTLKPGPKMINSTSVPRIQPTTLKKADDDNLRKDTNMTFDKAVRPTLLGGYMSGNLEIGSNLFTTPAPNAYDNANTPIHLRERVRGGVMSLPIEDHLMLGPAPHDYQDPLANRTKELSYGLINPIPAQGPRSDAAHGNWWERGRGPGKYVVDDVSLRPAAKLTQMMPLPTAADAAHDRARLRGIEMAHPRPGPAHYHVNEQQIRTWRTKGVGFASLRAPRELGKDNGDSNDVPYLNPPMPGVTSIYEGPGTRIGYSLGTRTALGVELEQMRRASEPSAQSYDATNSAGEKHLYHKAPSYTLGAKPYEDPDAGPLSGPGPMTYTPSSMSENLTGAWKISVRGSNYTHQYNARAASLHLPFPEKKPSDVPGPGEYLNLPDPIGNSDLPGALLGRELDPNADIKALMQRDIGHVGAGPGAFMPQVGRRGSSVSIGQRAKHFHRKKRQAIVNRARMKMLRARNCSAATWNG